MRDMKRAHVLTVVLSAIILLNIIAIVLLSNRADRQQEEVRAVPNSALQPEAQEVVRENREEKALVKTLLLVPRDCPQCFDISFYLEELNKTINIDPVDADPSLIGAARLPALAFNATLEEYPGELVTGWETYGEIVEVESGEHAGRWYVLPTLNPPYVQDGMVRGLVDVTYLVMDSCENCYDVYVNRQFMDAFGITPASEEIFDVASDRGRKIVKQYNITSVPTIIMSGDAGLYPGLRAGWAGAGSIEDDGSYVLRNLQRLQVTYYDLGRDRVMVP